jgi:WD40 repeat protein
MSHFVSASLFSRLEPNREVLGLAQKSDSLSAYLVVLPCGKRWNPFSRMQCPNLYGDSYKVWQALTWDDDPDVLNLPTASIAIAWSPDSKYLASANLDNTLTVWEWDYPDPWVMRGFPGKIRNLVWSEPVTSVGASLLVVSSFEGIVV